MPSFSKSSLNKLNSCHPDLQRLFNEVIKTTDCSVICGYRNKAEQEKAYKEGKSKAKFGESLHNYSPSLAVDVIPYPVDWKNIQSFRDFSKIVLNKAKELGIEITWGGNFKSFFDGPHYELADPSLRKKQ